eukprot:CAMPEP_0172562282 /NCGR_PEP_ID=MMETSP1067-20121228/96353_1 /TAXON_ID=265564 ORGANISM="Thalassiosira punctigera, Strain Tpunct2005C2" /NCGR_SAMPLE_ID=MMETSP1067 /ASSEMBLY_ACC=CAM_ASM_000444 /LENGTH=292 /DNA_ID=CAMNT_0013352481 /DNA_START=32 /DNA_END=910 /DNA_ORIENTATION=+
MNAKQRSPPWLAFALNLLSLASITSSGKSSFLSAGFICPARTHPFHAAATKNVSYQSPKLIDVGTTSTRLNSSRNNIFRRINNTFESSLATIQSVLFFGKLPSSLPPGMHSVPTQFIAALGDPASSSAASGAEQWGIWRIDPGPRGVFIKNFQANPSMGSKNARMPSGWVFDPNDFWIEEYGRVMEKPDFPLTPGRYLVTGGREATTLLTVSLPNDRGEQGWKFGEAGVTLYDVTHLPCRSARYHPNRGEKFRSPADANVSDFPVTPGSEMPAVEGCDKQDYAVLFVIAVDD